MDVQGSDTLHFKLFAAFIVLNLVITLATPLSYDKSSFSFPSFDPNFPTVRFNGDASISNSAIQLTRNNANTNLKNSFGRAIYPKPVHLWDKTTGNLADFTTYFSFIIDSGPNNTWPADGLAFFLAPNGSSFPNPSGGGGFSLGTENTTSDPDAAFVAVEFDTYPNRWDPSDKHIGIDINSVNSLVTAPWPWNKVQTGGLANASISYSSATQTLMVLLIDASVNGSYRDSTTLSAPINMRGYLPEWVEVGFSAATGVSAETHAIYSWEFTSSLQVLDKNESNSQRGNQQVLNGSNDQPTNLPPVSAETRNSNSLAWVSVGISVFLFIIIILGSTWFFWRSRKKKHKINEEEDNDNTPQRDEEFVTTPRKFSYSELASATNNFSDQQLLGEGGFGKVFKGYLSSINSFAAIKKVTTESNQGMKEFMTEVHTISQLRHKNLLQLMGWCHEKKELLLVYEFMTNGSLDSYLFKKRSCLQWGTRLRIAQGLASALLYLHDAWKQCVVHRDIKTSNIMLDSDFDPKLGDFGLARLVDHAKGSQTTILAGTLGYMAPECVYTSKAGRESDIYSFGVVLLEIACGRRVVKPQTADGNMSLVDWVWELYGSGNLLHAADPKLEGNFEAIEIERVMIVGLWCAHPDSTQRPTIREVISMLNFETSPPILPSKLPIPSYLAPPANNHYL